MIEITNCYSKLNLDSRDFTKILKGMNDAGLKSVIWQSKIAFLSTAGITNIDKEILDWMGYYNVKETSPFIYRGDLFIEGKDIIYIINESSGFSNPDRRIELGIISANKSTAQNLLRKYVKQFETSLKTGIDGRRSRYMTLTWYKFPENDKVDTHVSYYKSFTYPLMSDLETTAALQLTDSESRLVLRKIASHDSTKIFDIKGDQKHMVTDIISKLISWELVASKFIIICKKNSMAIASVESKEEITGENVIRLSCPHCSRKFSEETIKESFVLSELGRKMNDGSHWMTVLITNTLLESGIPEKSIIWNLTEDSEEVDCVVQFLDKTWIFELKDRNFESGDAHPLSYRAVKFKANKIVIFTTGNVTKEARKVFQDLSLQSYNKVGGVPLYIEGVPSLKPAIDTLIKNETLLHVQDKARKISQITGVDCSPIFSTLLGKYVIELEGGKKESIDIFK